MQPKDHANAVGHRRAHGRRMEEPHAGTPAYAARVAPSWPARLVALQVELEVLADECARWLGTPSATTLDLEQDADLWDTVSKLDAAAALVAAIDLPRGYGR